MSAATPITSAAFDRVTDALHRLGSKQAGKMWSCPAHDDRTPSLCVTAGDGRAQVKCFAGCDDEDVLRELGLGVSDLFDEPLSRDKSRAHSQAARPKANKWKGKVYSTPDDLKRVAEWKATQDLGKGACVVATYSYDHPAETKPRLVVFRAEREREDGAIEKTFIQGSPEGDGWKLSTKGVELIPYNMKTLRDGIEAGYPVYITEGEKDVHAVERAGGIATCNPMGADNPVDLYTQQFMGAKKIIIVADKDESGTGLKHAKEWAKALRDVSSDVSIVEAVEGKDAHDAISAGYALVDAFRPIDVTDLGGDDHDDAGWDDPIPIGSRDVPLFPLDALPDVMRDLCVSIDENTESSADLAACAGLGVLSTFTTGRVSVRMSDSWINPVALYIVSMADSGGGKGPAFRYTTEPLKEVQKELREGAREKVASAQADFDMADKRAKHLLDKAAKAEGEDALELREQARRAAAELSGEVRPSEPAYYLNDDVTEAALAGALTANKQRIGIVSGEARTLFDNANGKFTQGTPEMRILLSGWDGEPCEQLRVGRGAVDLSHPQLSVNITLQPSTFNKFMEKQDLADAGLFNRFLISHPTASVNLDQMPDGEVNRAVVQHWRLLVRDMAAIPDRRHHGWLLDFSPEARIAFSKVRLRFRQMRHEDGLFEHIQAYGPKFDSNVGRLVGLLHVAERAAHGENARGVDPLIEVGTVERAMRIAEYFAVHAASSFGDTGRDPGDERADIILKRLKKWAGTSPEKFRYDAGRAFIDGRTIQRSIVGTRTRIQNKAEMIEGFSCLEELGWVRPGYLPKAKRGAPGTMFELNPVLFK